MLRRLAFLFALNASVLAQAPSAASVAKAVDEHYNHLHSLQARYSERYQGMGVDRSETGTLTLRKPGRMRWAYDSPRGKLFILNGKEAVSYTPGDAQAQRIPSKHLDDLRSPLRFLLGHTQLAKELDGLSMVPRVNGTFELSGVPRGIGGRVRLLTLNVSEAGAIQILRFEEVDGSSTSFIFTDQHEDIPTRDSDFVFTPPPGVEIVTTTPPV